MHVALCIAALWALVAGAETVRKDDRKAALQEPLAPIVEPRRDATRFRPKPAAAVHCNHGGEGAIAGRTIQHGLQGRAAILDLNPVGGVSEISAENGSDEGK